MKTNKYKNKLKPYRIMLTCMFEIGKNNMFSSSLSDIIYAADLVDAHSKAVRLCAELNAANTAYTYEIEHISYEGDM